MMEINVSDKETRIKTNHKQLSKKKIKNEIVNLIIILIAHYRYVMKDRENSSNRELWDDIMKNIVDINPDKFEKMIKEERK
ncbi:hypothetical protein [Eubacterium ventriosum]|uniref:hypothetical protein n=1 Tax=Eubacterium ventriosum TaxID=39496 RepID=UPI0039946743